VRRYASQPIFIALSETMDETVGPNPLLYPFGNVPGASPAEPVVTTTEVDIQRFFVAKWRNASCEVCNVPNMWIVSPKSVKYVVFPAIGEGEVISTNPPKVFVALHVTCRNCGNFKFLSAKVIYDWVQANPLP
jgi:hypothetical protein